MDRVLVVSYAGPIGVITPQRAAQLLLTEKAIAASETLARVFKTTRGVFNVPNVILVTEYINVPRRRARWTKRGVFIRDDWTCVFCGIGVGEQQNGKILTKSDFTIDHIIPRAQGGKDKWGNTACACYSCNQRKGSRTPTQAGMKLQFEPKIPRTNYVVVRGEIPVEWSIWLERQ